MRAQCCTMCVHINSTTCMHMLALCACTEIVPRACSVSTMCVHSNMCMHSVITVRAVLVLYAVHSAMCMHSVITVRAQLVL